MAVKVKKWNFAALVEHNKIRFSFLVVLHITGHFY
jgi:hypothetical protein